MKNTLNITAIMLIIFGFYSCEDPIEIDNGFETPQLVVDAWINNNPGEVQTITITESQDYFDNRLPTPISNAKITLSSEGDNFEFVSNGEGDYTFDPGFGSIGSVGQSFDLSIELDGKTYTSTTKINRSPSIDSISIYFDDDVVLGEEGLYAQLYAVDFPGKGDAYWIRSYRNDTLLNKPEEINVAYDGAFNPGTELDGVTFIRPIRFLVNAVNDLGLARPLNPGDKVTCEIHSVSDIAFDFILNTQTQLLNTGLFAAPVANSKGNIRDAESGERILGVFNIAEVSKLEKIVE